MLGGNLAHSRFVPRFLAAAVAVMALAWPACNAWGQIVRNAVGGVFIDAEGLLREASPEERQKVLDEVRRGAATTPEDLADPAELRKISLRGLEAAIEAARGQKLAQLPDEIRYLGGLVRLRYVFLYPDSNDIVLAGPGEGWTINDAGIAVGKTTGRPVLLLEDLLTALRSVAAARESAISCSIDPTAEGYQKLNALLDRQRRTMANGNIRALEAAMKAAFGPQQIVLAGVPSDSHFARVLVSADYRMKRLGMNLEEAPIQGLPSYLDLVKNARSSSLSTNPRWWLACDYEPLARSDDGLAWQLRGPGVKTMTEEDFVSADGKVHGTGRKNPLAQKWADLFSEKYEELSASEAVFGQLRNLMDLCVVAALIERHDLMTKAGCSLPLLTGAAGDLSGEPWNSPKTVAPQCSFLKIRSGWLVTASGGVQIEPWSVVARTEPNDQVKQRREEAAPAGKTWRWN